jgi:DNA topoisomerase-1
LKLVVSEKNIAAKRIAEILAVGKPTTDKVYSTPVYRFRRDGEDWVSIGLKGHIMGVEFPAELQPANGGWTAVRQDGEPESARLPAKLPAEKPVALKGWKLESLPYLTWAPVDKAPAEKGIIQSLRSLAKKADDVIIATDFDREGELIGKDAADIVRDVNPNVPVARTRFSAITKGEIERAFSEMGTVDECLAAAGASRQDIDLIWGAVLTRYLTLANQTVTKRPFGDVLSAGRVQTPTLKIIVDREAERDAFVPETYWQVKADLKFGADEFTATHATDRFSDEAAARAAFAAADGAVNGSVTSMETTRRTQRPPTPFNTTSLQAAAASEGISPSQTMRVAESLYMDGLISYPRVDNTVYPPSLDMRELLDTLHNVPEYRTAVERIRAAGPLHPTRGAKETTDHPPIHPTGAADLAALSGQNRKIYNMVARRFLATLSDAAVIEGTKATLDIGGQPFVAKGDILVVPGFRAIYPFGLKKDEVLPPLTQGASVDVLAAHLDEKQTQPPARYSQGRLIQEMEKLGLGTKATRHDIIQTLYDRRYTVNDPVEPTVKGKTVIGALTQHAERITNPEMTHQLDEEMDAITQGSTTREAVVTHSRELLADIIDRLLPHAEDMGQELKDATDADATLGTCKKCGKDLRIKFSPRNKSYFVGCSGYPDCDATYPLPRNYKFEAVDEPCSTCGMPQVKLIAFKRKPQIVCLDPACPTRSEPDIDLGKCPAEGCGGEIIARRSPSSLKRFARCTNYEKCQTSYPLPGQGELVGTGKPCEACGAPMITVQTRRGPWTICANHECPTREQREAAKTTRGRGAAGKAGAAKKPAARKKATTRRKAAPRKAAADGATSASTE